MYACNRLNLCRSLIAALSLSFAVLPSAIAQDSERAEQDSAIVEAIKNGKPIIDVRYRFELKEQEGFAENAHANTVRTRLGYESGELFNFKVLVEFENIFSIGDDHFNSTTNGLTQFPVIADPDATEINRAQIMYTGFEKTPITIGRQRFNLNNHRFIGAVDFRQNQQTFDAARLSSTIIDNLTFDYLYIDRVHRIFGDDHPFGEFNSDSHVISAAYNAGEFGVFKTYGVLLDFNEAPALSSATWGVRYENKFLLSDSGRSSISIVGEYASQRDYAANPTDYQESYIHGEATIKAGPFSFAGGFEQLGGDGTIAFSTPLATLHKFQGFADVFLSTPAAGIEDIYATIAFAWNEAPIVDGLKIFTTYHEFESQTGNTDYGHEIDAGLSANIHEHWTAEIKGAVYEGASAFADRSIVWASLRFQY